MDFDVADQNGSDGASHAVGTDTQVVLELTNDDGETLECTPVEVTETMWNDAMDDVGNVNPYGAPAPVPAWPGLGHYIYPTVNFAPHIDGFGTVTGVGFKVTSIPDGHTLEAPTGVQPLDVHYAAGVDASFVVDPVVTSYLTSQVGADAAAAYNSALASCAADPDGLIVDAGVDLAAALNAHTGVVGLDGHTDPSSDIACNDLAVINSMVSLLLGLDASVNYTEPITLSLPDEPTTTPSTTTPPAAAPQAVAAKPVNATPSYTG